MIKHHRNKNDYYYAQNNIWVRNPYKENVPYKDINRLSTEEDCKLFSRNEIVNSKKKYSLIDKESIAKQKIIIISDGFDFLNKHKILSSLPPDVCVIATNGALNEWSLVGESCNPFEKRAISYYVVNNPYEECQIFFPSKNNYFPNCIASTRTNCEFLKKYNSFRKNVFLYVPSNDINYSSLFHSNYKIDDYRNPICAALNLSVKFKVKKIMLFCCDECFKEEKPGSIKISNGLFHYPQNKISHDVIDACLYWIKTQDVEISYTGEGAKFENASYINEENINIFFNE